MFALALQKYFEKNFSQAKQMFENLVQLNDAPSKIYVDRCQKLLEHPPLSDWDGVWSMTDK
jgi:adenylate cyclase